MEAVAVGIPRVGAMYLFFEIFKRCPPIVCPVCEVRSRPPKPGYIARHKCKRCGGSWANIQVVSGDARRRMIARSTANVAVRRGVLKREPCSKCGEKIAEKHHHDYSKPLDVTWLCRKCHMQEHKRMEMA
jgi:ribosomal protein S27AE